jgi:hypothetical protein
MDTRDDTNQVDEKTSQRAAMLLAKMLQVRMHDAAINIDHYRTYSVNMTRLQRARLLTRLKQYRKFANAVMHACTISLTPHHAGAVCTR